MEQQQTIQTLRFDQTDTIPNNPNLPVLLYRRGLPRATAAECKALFAENGWGGMWENGVFAYHHYHSNAHEVLGVISGKANLQIGGPDGEVLEVISGDVLLLPAGTGHCNKGATADFRVVGAYPPGQENYDLHRDKPEGILARIRQVEIPQTDPIFGQNGPLHEHWR